MFFIFQDKPKEEKKDTFLEKLAAQVIKNLQVKITNIHIRYEDDVSTRSLLCIWGYVVSLNRYPNYVTQICGVVLDHK